MEHIIYNRSGERLASVRAFEYVDNDMGTCSVTMTVKSAVPIGFGNGDYLIFRNEKFTLNYAPSVLKQARSGAYGEAFVYEGLTFNSCRDELTRCMFYDIVPADNKIPYTSLPTVTFTDSGLRQIQMRVQANLDRTYGAGAWEVTVEDGVKRRDGGAVRDYNYSFDGQSVWDVLVRMSESQDVAFTVRGVWEAGGDVVDRREITLGAVHDVVTKSYSYGRGNGFKSIEAQSSESEQVVTVLHVYGNTTNMPWRYYNHLSGGSYDKGADWEAGHPLASLYMPRLSLPGLATAVATEAGYWNRDLTAGDAGSYAFRGWVTLYDSGLGETEEIGEADFALVMRGGSYGGRWYVEDAYLQSVRGYGRYGHKEGNKNFDTDDDENGYDDIYPSAKWLTDGSGSPLAKVTGGSVIEDNGIPDEAGGIGERNFEVTIADVGFNVRDDRWGADAVPQMVMTSGMCTGRAFDINSCDEVTAGGRLTGYRLRCTRTLDEGIDRYFPYSDYQIKEGDTFAFLNIQMPAEYVEAASEQLLREGLRYLGAHDSNTIVLKPELDNIFLAEEDGTDRLADALRSGLRLNILDDDVTASTPISGLTISSVRITVGRSAIDEYEITLSSEKEADMVSRVVSEVKNYLAAGSGAGVNTKTVSDIVRQTGRKLFLSRTEADTAQGRITLSRGAQYGESFAEGQAGTGGLIDGSGSGWLESLSLRSFLEAPEYRFNRISIQTGNRWRAPGGGIIERAEPDKAADGSEPESGTIWLHLEDGEGGTLREGDICQGIWHDGAESGNNSADDYDDGKGNFRFAGFFTTYFRITSVRSDGGVNNVLTYALRSDSRWKAEHHPRAMMHFVAYGSFTDRERRQSRYSTLTYERYLRDVDTWEFGKGNIAAQFGDLTNLSVFGIEMGGYSAYLNNIYMSGTIRQIDEADVVMEITDSLDGFIAEGETDTIRCRLWKGFAGNDVTGLAEAWKIERESGSSADDAVWNNSEKARSFDGEIGITLGDLGRSGISTLFTVTATGGDNRTIAKGDIEI